MKFPFKDFICKCRVTKCHPQITANESNDLRPDLLDTRRKLNPFKSFIARPGHLLNVLCTLYLRPASMGRVILYMSTTFQSSNMTNHCEIMFRLCETFFVLFIFIALCKVLIFCCAFTPHPSYSSIKY